MSPVRCACGSRVTHAECLNAEHDLTLARFALAQAETLALAVYDRNRRRDDAEGTRP